MICPLRLNQDLPGLDSAHCGSSDQQNRLVFELQESKWQAGLSCFSAFCFERWTKTSGRRERDHQVILDMVGGILARGMLLHCEICLFTEEIHITVYRWFHLTTNRTQKPDFNYPLQISGQAKLRIRLFRFTVLLLGHLMKLEIPPQRRLESLSSVILRWLWMAARRSVYGFEPSFSFVFMWLSGLLEEVTVN